MTELKTIPVEKLTEIFVEQYTIDELRQEGYVFEVFFDAHDIYTMIQGFWSLEDNKGRFRKRTIDLDDVGILLKGLAYFGRVGNLRVFRPHMVEISRLLERDHCFPIREVPDYVLEDLFQYLSLAQLKAYEINRQTKDKVIGRRLDKLVRKSKNLFKAYYILTEPNWSNRADYLLTGTKPMIRRDEKNYDLHELSASDLFLRLKDYFKDRRKKRSVNNLRDSLSLGMLLETLRQYRKEDPKRIPLFLASSDVILELGEDSRFKEEFEIKAGAHRINLLKSPEFFLFDVIFSDYDHSSAPMFLKLNELKAKRRLFNPGNINPELLEGIKKDMGAFVNQEFYGILSDINNQGFDFDTSIARLLEFQKALKDPQYREKFEKEREEIVSKLRKYTEDLDLFESIWAAVDRIDEVPLNEALLDDDRKTDIFRDTGLTRFSPLPGRVERELLKLWEDLVNQRRTDIDIYNRAKQEVVRCVFEGIKTRNIHELMIGCSILWVFEAYDILNKVLSRMNFDYGSYTLAFIHAAALCMSNDPEKHEMVDRIMKDVMKDPGMYEANYKVWMALSYINFRIWESEYSGPYIIDRKPRNIHSEYYGHFLTSIKLAGRAIVWLSDKVNKEPAKVAYRNVKYLYLRNIYIYYLTRAGDQEQFLSEDMEVRVEELDAERGKNPQYWQSAFDHTIASYYLRRYFLENDEEARKVYFGLAQKAYEKFTRGALFIPERHTALGKAIEWERLRQARKKE